MRSPQDVATTNFSKTCPYPAYTSRTLAPPTSQGLGPVAQAQYHRSLQTRVSSTHLAFISTTKYPACLATTCASVVLPSPGGPHSSATTVKVEDKLPIEPSASRELAPGQ